MGARLGVCGARASVSFALGREAKATRQRASPTSVSMCNVRVRLRGNEALSPPAHRIGASPRLPDCAVQFPPRNRSPRECRVTRGKNERIVLMRKSGLRGQGHAQLFTYARILFVLKQK